MRNVAAFFTLWWLGTACIACSNYGLLGHLENPGRSEETGKDAGTVLTDSCQTDCRIFVTALGYTGNLGGLSGADTKCMADPNRPADAGRQWRALLSATDRKACTGDNCPGGSAENLNWVLKPNATYRRPDGTLIGNTSASALLLFNLAQPIATAAGNTWTGTYANWTSGALSDRCNDWTDAGLTNGIYALSGSVTATAIANFHAICSGVYSLYCVEQ